MPCSIRTVPRGVLPGSNTHARTLAPARVTSTLACTSAGSCAGTPAGCGAITIMPAAHEPRVHHAAASSTAQGTPAIRTPRITGRNVDVDVDVAVDVAVDVDLITCRSLTARFYDLR